MVAIRALVTVAFITLGFGKHRRLGGTPSVTSTSASIQQPTDFIMVSRTYVPFGNGDGYAFGMGAAEQIAYDEVHKYVYAISEQGYVNVVDMEDPTNPQVLSNYALDLNAAKLTDIEICPQHNTMFISAGASDTVSNGQVHAYTTVQRASPDTPTLLSSVTVGPLPDMILPNSDCTKIAVANEGEGRYTSNGLVDPEGSVDILTVIVSGGTVSSMSAERVELGTHTDEQLINMDVHLPLPLNAMEYWSEHSDWAAGINFTTARNSYSPRMNLEPEYLAWSADSSRLYVNMQENNAIAVIDVDGTSSTFEGIYSLGMKDHSTIGIDIVKDSACTMATYQNFQALRMPDSIQAVSVDGQTYILTANEGDDKKYGDFEEKQKLKDLFQSDGTVTSEFSNMNVSGPASDAVAAIRAVSSKMRVTVGSSAIDFSIPSNPKFQNVVAMGGRGISIFRDTGSGLELAWDSGSLFETQLCANYPNSYNAIQDEEFSPVNGVLYNMSSSGLKETIEEMSDPNEDGCADSGNGSPGACPLGGTIDERSPKDGAGTEAIVAGIACGSLVAVTATEKSGVAFVWDITTIDSPSLLFVKHLSPVSETKNPGLAYASSELGEIDPESIIFLDAQHSPSGNAGVFFGGAWSGTVSFWEFQCPDATDSTVGQKTLARIGLLLFAALATATRSIGSL
jgi:hypothetical protein